MKMLFLIISSCLLLVGCSSMKTETTLSENLPTFNCSPNKCEKIDFLGLGTYTELGLTNSQESLISGFTPNAEGIDKVAARRFFWRVGKFIVSVEDNSIESRKLVAATASAFSKIRTIAPEIYNTMQSKQFTTGELLSNWRNRNANLVVSFDNTPRFIAAQTTIVNTKPIQLDSIGYYKNTAIISIDLDNIAGNSLALGSGKIYQSADAQYNYERYLMDGLVYSIAHEFFHVNIDKINSTSLFANELRSGLASEVKVNAEEAIVVASTLYHLKDGLSKEMVSEANGELNRLLSDTDTNNAVQNLCDLLKSDSKLHLRYSCPL